MKRFLFSAVILLFGFSTLLYAAPKVKIRFDSDDDDSRQVQNLLISHFNLSDRYTVVTDNSADILINVTCLHANQDGSRFCATSLYLWPCAKAFLAFGTPDLQFGRPDYIAQSTFVSLVNYTSDERIAKMWATFAYSVKKACEADAEGCNTVAASQIH
jgi:hypothetical protein